MNPLEALHKQFLEEKQKQALAEQQDNDSRTTAPTVATTEAMSTNKVTDPHAAYRKQFQEGQDRQFREWQEVQKRPLEKKREEERQHLHRQQELLEPQAVESTPSETTAAATELSPEAPVQKHPPQQSRHQHDGGEQLTAAEHVGRRHEPAPRKIAGKTRLVKHRSARSKNNDHGQKELQSAVDLLSKKTEPKMTEPKNRKISARKIEANRKNAQKSPGPTSIRGKQAVALNALKHGFLSRVAVIKDRDGGESQDEFDQLHTKLRANLQPVGCMEDLLVERIAVSHWRKRRLLRYENGMISDRFACRRDAIATRPARWGKPDTERQLELDMRTDHVCMPGENVQLMLRYEAMIEKQLNRDFAMLQQLQLRRKSLRTPANGATPLSLELTEPRGQVLGNAVDESNPNNLLSSASDASNIRQTDNTACSAEGGTKFHAQRPVTDASYPQQVGGAVHVAEELMEPQTQEVGSDAGDLRQVDGAGPSPEEIKVSQAQGPEEQGERFYETKPRSALFSDSPADHLPGEGNSATSTNKNGEDV